jgi:hypothetical protein
LFAALALAGVDTIGGMPVTWLRQRCLDAILASGVPARLRPGFWTTTAAAAAGTSWMQGAAGIAAFLLRLARVMRDDLTAPVVDRPDQWWAVPARLRTVHTGPQT